MVTGNPEVALSNSGRNKAIQALARLVSGQAPLIPAILDEHQTNRSVQHLRSLLVAAGILPARDERMARPDVRTARTAHTVTPAAGCR